MGAVTAMAAAAECRGPDVTGRVGSHLSVATSAGRGRGPGGFSVEPPTLTGGGLFTARTRQAMSLRRSTHCPRSAWSFDRLLAGFPVQWSWSGSRTRDRRLARSLLYPSELSSGG